METILTTYGTGFPTYSRAITLPPGIDPQTLVEAEALNLASQLGPEDLSGGKATVAAILTGSVECRAFVNLQI